MKFVMSLLLVAVIIFPSMSQAAEPMREGLWEIATTTEMPGMPMKIPPTIVKHCYTKEDVKDQKKVVSTDKDCKITDYKFSGNKMTWAMKCTGKNSGTMNGTTIFGTDSYTSDIKMKSQGHSMAMKVKAKRIGNCK